MIELARFARRLIKHQSPAFNFEHASVALLSGFKHHHRPTTLPSITSEWRDPPALRMDDAARQGACHG